MVKAERAPVSVVMPEIKLSVADLAYMTGLMPGGTRCVAANSTRDRLVFLGLIELSEIPPCQKAIASFEKDQADWRKKHKAAVLAGRWEDISDVPYRIRESNRPSAKKDYVLTASGRELMAKGRARSMTSAKGGCVK